MSRDKPLSTSMPAQAEPEAVPVPEAARRLGIKRSKLYKLFKDGTLPSFRLGKRRLVRVAAIRALVARLEADSQAA